MGLSLDFHLKTLYGSIIAMAIGWSGGIAWSACEHKELTKQINDVRYDNGIRLASIETSLKQINLNLIEITRDVKAMKHTGYNNDAQQE